MEFIQNKYTKIYFDIVKRAQERTLSCYKEEHHIIPSSLGGDNSPDNKVFLLAREHYIVHRLLVKMTQGIDKMKMAQAAWTMARTRKKKVKISSRTYAYLREENSKVSSKRQKGVPKGPKSEEHKQRIREATIRRYQDPAERLKTGLTSKGRFVSDETKAKLSTIRKGKIPKHIPSMKGKQHSAETK
jgi:hypothetical protein